MARKGFIYFLFNKDKKPLFVDDSGFVQVGTDDYFKPDGQPARLVNAPEGWKDTLVKYVRNIKYWGVIRDYTVPMKFIGDGATILRKQIWEQRGTETTTYLGIAKLDRTGLPYNYYSWYLSEINFTKFVQSKIGFQAEALEGGMAKFLKAYENTVYEIPIDDDPEHINILMDGFPFENRAIYLIDDGFPDSIYGQHTFELQKINTETIGISSFTTERKGFANNTDLYNTGQFFLQTGNSATSVRFKYRIGVTPGLATGIPPNPVAGGKIVLRAFDLTGTFVAAWTIQDYGGASNFYQHQILENDITISGVPANCQLFLCHFLTLGGTIATGPTADEVVKWQYDSTSDDTMEITYEYRHIASTIKALRAFRLLGRLIYKMTEGKYTAKSTQLESMLDYCVTSGDALRGIAGAKIKTSLSDFFKSFFSRFNLCLTVHNDQLVMEPMKDFFKTDIICDLGVVDDATVSPAEDLLYNTIKCGYEKKDYTDANGKYEPNQGQQWTMPVSKTVRELDLKSPYRADSFGIELLRINFDKLTTTDSGSDNDTFVLNITTTNEPVTATVDFVDGSPDFMLIPGITPFRAGQLIRIETILAPGPNDGDYTIAGVGAIFGAQVVFLGTTLVPITGQDIRITFLSQGVYDLYRPPYSSVTGIPHPDYAFNLELTPKKGLLANASYLHSILDLLDTEKIKFQSADKNAELSTTLAGVTVKENEDIQIGNLAAPYFRPYYINFRTKVPVNLVELLKVNPWGRIKFTYNGTDFYGYLMDGGIRPATNDAQTWKLLSAPENDLNKL